MSVCVCDGSSLCTADGANNTCGFPRVKSPTATADALRTKSGSFLFALLNGALSKPTDTQRRMGVNV